MAADILITIALVTGAVLIFNQIARMVRNGSMHRTIRNAMNRDNGALGDLIARIDEEQPLAGRDDGRLGLILIALAVALAGYAIIAAPSEEDLRNMAGLALFPGLVGIVLMGHAAWLRRRGGMN